MRIPRLPASCLTVLLPACMSVFLAGAAAAAPVAADPTAGDGKRTVAEIAGKPVTFAELLNEAHASLASQSNEYELRRRQLDIDYRRAQQATLEEQLDKFLDRRAVELEADARKTNALKLLGEVKTPPVTDEEVRALYEARKVPGAPAFEQVAAQLKEGLEQQKTEAALQRFYAGLRAKHKITASLDPLRSPVAADGPSRGPTDALVTIVEFADFQCPYCRRLEPELTDILKRYPTQVRLVYKHYPLDDIHPQALHAAQAAVCAGNQGKFWEIHDGIFADTTPLSLNSLRSIAQRAEMDTTKFEECVRSQDPNSVIGADIRAGNDLAVRSTPALFVNGRYIEGAVPEEKIVAVIEDELKRQPAPATASTR